MRRGRRHSEKDGRSIMLASFSVAPLGVGRRTGRVRGGDACADRKRPGFLQSWAPCRPRSRATRPRSCSSSELPPLDMRGERRPVVDDDTHRPRRPAPSHRSARGQGARRGADPGARASPRVTGSVQHSRCTRTSSRTARAGLVIRGQASGMLDSGRGPYHGLTRLAPPLLRRSGREPC